MTSTTTSKILYIDDDSDDFIFLSESLAASGNPADLIAASDGEDAINYLNSVEEEALPSLIVLDLNMPKKDGRQTLRYLKTNPHFSQIPVVILSTSTNKNDKEICKTLGAASYLQKPNNYNGYKDIIKNFMSLLSHD